MIFTLDLKTPSLNEWYAGSHWSKRSAYKKQWRDEIAFYCHKHRVEPFDEFPYDVTIQACYKRKGNRDTDNTIPGVKLFIDALKHLELIPEDDTRYIGKIEILPPVVGWTKDQTVITIE